MFYVEALCNFPQVVTEKGNVLLLKNKCDEQALKYVNIASVALMFRHGHFPKCLHSVAGVKCVSSSSPRSVWAALPGRIPTCIYFIALFTGVFCVGGQKALRQNATR